MGEIEISPLPKIRKLTEGLKERIGAKRLGKPRKSDSKRESEDDALISPTLLPERGELSCTVQVGSKRRY